MHTGSDEILGLFAAIAGPISRWEAFFAAPQPRATRPVTGAWMMVVPVMDGSGATQRLRWGVGWGLRVFAGLGLGVTLVIGWLLASGGERTSDRVGGTVFLVVFPLLAWVFYWRPYVELTASSLFVRNRFGFTS